MIWFWCVGLGNRAQSVVGAALCRAVGNNM